MTTTLNIECRYCGAKPGESCRNKITGNPFSTHHVHTSRITDAKTIIPLPPPLKEELF